MVKNTVGAKLHSVTNGFNFDDTTKPLAEELIKAGWRSMAKKYHPDITKDNGQKIIKINEVKDKLIENL